jgi:hypothetical protein
MLTEQHQKLEQTALYFYLYDYNTIDSDNI